MADSTTVQALKDYYVNLLIIQYNLKPKARATIELFVGELIASGIYLDVRDAYNLETAVGAQLDIIGQYVGVDRFFFTQQLDGDYFGFADAQDMAGVSANIVGFDDASAPSKTGEFLDASALVGSELRLNDTNYRQLIKLKIAQNNSSHSTKSISDILFDSFAGDVILTDGYDMTITYLFNAESTILIEAAREKMVLPKPAGVGIKTIINGTQFFGFADAEKMDAIPSYVSGFNDASTGFLQSGGFLDAANDII